MCHSIHNDPLLGGVSGCRWFLLPGGRMFGGWRTKKPEKKNGWKNGDMSVSKNRGTPKWMVYKGKPYKKWWFGGTTILGNTQMKIWFFDVFSTRKTNRTIKIQAFFSVEKSGEQIVEQKSSEDGEKKTLNRNLAIDFFEKKVRNSPNPDKLLKISSCFSLKKIHPTHHPKLQLLDPNFCLYQTPTVHFATQIHAAMPTCPARLTSTDSLTETRKMGNRPWGDR